MRRLNDEQARPLAGTEGARVPAVSHDGRWVAFSSAGVIRKVPIAGGLVTDVAPGTTGMPRGMAWDDSGRLFFGEIEGGIWQIPPGGAPAPVIMVREGEVGHSLSCPLPGGRTLLYTVHKRNWTWGDDDILAHTIGTGERRVLLHDATDARYLPS